MSNLLPTDYQSFIHQSRYAKYVDGKGRESWAETVGRYMDNVVRPKLGNDSWSNEIEQAILSLDVMPSMRAMMTSGVALDRDNTAGYNCSYLPVDDPKSFDEAMFILLCGTGVGFSVERQFVQQLPEVPELFDSETTIVVKDSKEGWAKSFRQLLALLWAGEIPKWDVTRVRPAGARLKTFGGRASGPAPLVELFNFSVNTFKHAQGRKLTSMECHDLMCFIGQIVVVGGVRRSAMISLSNLSDDRMRHAKSGQWWETAPHRALANNSVSYTEKPDIETFMREWTALVESKSERGEYLIVKHLKHRLLSMVGVILTGSLELIRAVKSYLDPTSSAILRRLLFVPLIRLKTWSVRSNSPQYLGQSKARTQSFLTCVKCGNVIRKKNVCLVCR